MALSNLEYQKIMRLYEERQLANYHLHEERKKEIETDLEMAIQKGRRCGISDEELKSLFEMILEG